MRRAPHRLLCLVVAGFALACHREAPTDEPEPASSTQLDRMQLGSARRVGLETATNAMQQGNVAQLKQLSVWVRKRAQVPIFEEDDLRALDLAIGCLEQSSSAAGAVEELDRLDSGKLKKPARELCASKAP